MADRYVVRELEGDLTMRDSQPQKPRGLSVIVLDSRVNYRRVAEYRTEEADRRTFSGQPTVAQARAWARAQAAELAARLNDDETS